MTNHFNRFNEMNRLVKAFSTFFLLSYVLVVAASLFAAVNGLIFVFGSDRAGLGIFGAFIGIAIVLLSLLAISLGWLILNLLIRFGIKNQKNVGGLIALSCFAAGITLGGLIVGFRISNG